MITIKVQKIVKLIMLSIGINLIIATMLIVAIFKINNPVHVPVVVEKEVVVIKYLEPIVCKNIEKEINTIEMDVPNTNSSFKSIMPYDTVTDRSTKQWAIRLLSTTNELGLRIYEDRYCVAVSEFYGAVTDKINITLESGIVLNCIIAESKNYNDERGHIFGHTMEDGSINVVEFIIDTSILSQDVQNSGDVSTLNEMFEGDVVKIEKVAE